MFEIVSKEVIWSVRGSYQTIWCPPLPNVTRHSGWWPHTVTPSIDRTLHQFLTVTDLDHITEFDLKNYLIVEGFHRTYATGAACQQRTLTPPDTWYCPTLGLTCVLMSRPISPELVLSPDIWISNTPRYFSFAFNIVVFLFILKSNKWNHLMIYTIYPRLVLFCTLQRTRFVGLLCYNEMRMFKCLDFIIFVFLFMLKSNKWNC